MKKGIATVIKRYFGNEGRTLTQFKAELDALSADEKLELATLAAKAMGMTQEQCEFPLDGHKRGW